MFEIELTQQQAQQKLAQTLQGLNEAQKKAVEHVYGPLLLVAGAGSGKTLVITARIARMIQTGVARPDEILGVTFTNKAANEMNERVHQLSDHRVWISTFHSMGARILREHGDRLGLLPGFGIYDDSDQTAVIKDCMKTHDAGDQIKPGAIAGKIGRLKDELIDPKTYAEFAYSPQDQLIAKIYATYQEALKANNAVDFSDLIMCTVKLLNNNRDLLEYYQDRFKYMLVDEYQDTNFAQYQLVKLLAQKHQNICVVGDPDQSIYSWRGADIRNILNFEKDYAQTQVINLEHNYRSTATILEAANHVIAYNKNRKDKILRATRDGGTPIHYYQAMDGKDEADFIVQQIGQAQRQGRSLKEMAVLYRVHALSRAMEEALITNRINYKVLGGMKFYDRKEIKDILCYLRFMANPSDRVSFNRIINTPKRGIGASTLSKLFAYSEQFQGSFADVLNGCEHIPDLSAKVVSKLKSFTSMIAALRNKMSQISVSDLLNQLLEQIEYYDYLKLDDPAAYTTRCDNIKELFAAIGEYEQRTPQATVAQYLEDVALLTDIQQEDTEEKIVLMTIHNAKGLEFHTCFLIGMEEGLFPYGSTKDDPEELEEERRLCYVGITRAKDRLYLSSAMRRIMYGRWNNSLPSRFLEDIPKHLLSSQGLSASLSLEDEEFSGSSLSAPDIWAERPMPQRSQVSEAAESYRKGDLVLHDKLGSGEVLSVEGQGDETRLKIQFGYPHGQKSLMLKFANLSKLKHS